MALVVTANTTISDLSEAHQAGFVLKSRPMKAGKQYTAEAVFESAPEFVTVKRELLIQMQAELIALRSKLEVAA